MKRVGLIVAEADEHIDALSAEIQRRGYGVALVDAADFTPERRFSFHDTSCSYNGDFFEDVTTFFLRSVMSPIPYVQEKEGVYHLYEDWQVDYERAREKHGFLLSWMLTLVASGKRFVNPPLLATMNPLKPLQIATLKRHGLPMPRTLVTNSSDEIRAFLAEVGPAIYKPVVGGTYCRLLDAAALEQLDAITLGPVIVQEYIPGANLRVTALPGQILSACAVSGDAVDFRATEAFKRGDEPMREVELPMSVKRMCWEAMAACNLVYSGIDLKLTPEGDYVLLECNYAPAWLHIEEGTGAPITERLVDFLLSY